MYISPSRKLEGIRKDNNQTKYLGIRPDDTQESGSQQIEWSLKSAKVKRCKKNK